jgi:hypothetical protein
MNAAISYPVISSAEVPLSRIEGSRVVRAEPAALPLRAIGAGQFTVGTTAAGLAQLLDPQGRPCGIFASRSMAEDTAAGLSQ